MCCEWCVANVQACLILPASRCSGEDWEVQSALTSFGTAAPQAPVSCLGTHASCACGWFALQYVVLVGMACVIVYWRAAGIPLSDLRIRMASRDWRG